MTQSRSAQRNGAAVAPTTTRVAIIGGGLSGIAAAVNLVQAGYSDFLVLEKAPDVGGVWRDNVYPGAACDTPSHLYSYSFEPNPEWKRSFSRQPQIHAYIRHVVEKYGLRDNLRLGTEVLDASWDDERHRWVLTTPDGQIESQLLLDCAGPLVEPSTPDIPGIEDFEGTLFHSARWDHDTQLAGRRVAVVGTGASAVQFVPELQPNVGRLMVFQRTAPWVSPKLDRHISAAERGLLKFLPPVAKALRANQTASRELGHYPLMRRNKLSRALVTGVTRIMLHAQVRDRTLRNKLKPNYELGCKRILMSNTWYSALVKPNVDVVTDAITRFTATGVQTADGTEHETDVIVLGTGFQVFDAPIAHRVHGRDGRSLSEAWGDQPHVFRGTTCRGFPNYFRFASIGSGLGHGSMIWQMEAQATYVVEALRTLDATGKASFDVKPEAVKAYMAKIFEDFEGSVWSLGGCDSWYKDASGAPSVLWPRSMTAYKNMIRTFDVRSYELFDAPVPSQNTGMVSA